MRERDLRLSNWLLLPVLTSLFSSTAMVLLFLLKGHPTLYPTSHISPLLYNITSFTWFSTEDLSASSMLFLISWWYHSLSLIISHFPCVSLPTQHKPLQAQVKHYASCTNGQKGSTEKQKTYTLLKLPQQSI